jgi:hypothetical protein
LKDEELRMKEGRMSESKVGLKENDVKMAA